ncbi:hypothetical protein BJY16_001983 [Actinoplanes octamycinicus]|uniref:DUF397 domain-containing protein n=1 Tax=Actinoplanes octamycinicus TaxID=135948 RepID=A0A7W7GUF8_9ACTN|nr:DUF397 domain-containing protein [Actinoplanes octamycinicus]MBB4738524.1 hypothetical protein [Actinoplanes octamycinicus]GIE57646.1 hypothetical protein Aoc01nite_30480 [Actinoplanes octamycinicus]
MAQGQPFAGSKSNCMEVADLPDGGFAVRDSKDPNGPILFFTPSERAPFIAGVRKEDLL